MTSLDFIWKTPIDNTYPVSESGVVYTSDTGAINFYRARTSLAHQARLEYASHVNQFTDSSCWPSFPTENHLLR